MSLFDAVAAGDLARVEALLAGGADPNPFDSEGRTPLIVAAQERFTIAPWLAFYPGVCIAVTALGFTLLGEALREALDPKQRR